VTDGTSTGSPLASTASDVLGRFPAIVPPVSTAGAAVTIVLRDGGEGTEVLLIERTNRPDDPASGQVALPGGRVSDSDGSLAVTALRELEEEVGLGEDDLDGPLRFVTAETAARFGLRVGVFAAKLGPAGRGPSARSAEEVAHVFWLPSARLRDNQPVERETHRGYARVSATVHEGHVLWGFTRRILRDFFELPKDDELLGPVFPRATEPPG
jgi:8-oxo-dGTP pyrophosphatase MutT (NUDIX family)